MEKLVLIDGNSLINRAFYAMPILSTKNGEYTNAVYGFMNMFFRLYSDVKPDYVAVAFDVHAPTFRHEAYADYKGTRKPMPEQLVPQFPIIKELLSLMGVTYIEQAGIEADDIIGTLAKNSNLETYIFTGDKDAFQLVDDKIKVCFTKRGTTDLQILNDKNFAENVGLTPSQIIDYKALRGDTSDNIPGVKGIGEKTALSLLQEYSDLDGVYANLDKLAKGVKEKLTTYKEDAYFSKMLATIKTDCALSYDLQKMRFSLPLSEKARQRFLSLELKSLLTRKELFSSEQAVDEQPKLEKAEVKIQLEKVIKVDNLSVLEGVDASELSIAYLEQALSVYSRGVEYFIPIQQTLLDEGFSLPQVLTATLKLIKACPRPLLYDKKEFRHLLLEIGFSDDFIADDLSILKYLTDYAGKAETLKQVVESKEKSLETPAFSQYLIFNELLVKLEEQGIKSLYYDVELPLSDVLFDMEIKGFKIDGVALANLGNAFSKKIEGLKNQICALAGEPNLNPNSPKQLGAVLFDKLQIAKGKKSKTGYNTSAEVLSSLEDAHPIVPLILEYRKHQKILATYIEGFKPLIDLKTGLIHTSFNQTTTSTGRLSSKEPNLQNIPVRTDEGSTLRKFFASRGEDRILISADYSQIELRLLASFSNCKPLIEAFNLGVDVHSATASKVFNVPIDKVTPDMRRKAKAVNFGIIYGISEFGLAKNINSTAKEARDYINAYFKEYPEVKAYMNENVAFAKTNGYSITMLKRRRVIPELLSPNYNIRQFGERASMNMPLQGSAADVIKLAMLNVFNRLKKENLRSELILQVHDELIIDAYLDEAEKVEKILIEEMEKVASLPVTLSVSVGKGKTWYEAK